MSPRNGATRDAASRTSVRSRANQVEGTSPTHAKVSQFLDRSEATNKALDDTLSCGCQYLSGEKSETFKRSGLAPKDSTAKVFIPP
eukprot:57023-Rhodomonas_salina.3